MRLIFGSAVSVLVHGGFKLETRMKTTNLIIVFFLNPFILLLLLR